ncbi:MAG TPA: hypothetical protein VHW09_21985 [Bryobacteraceae bacterium]|jgi:hypothetical protein|nr:hypothetical protein [Bryobacteraceae bacterium]
MATQKQIAANRRNALKSTGPRTPEGKARSSQNALKSGIDSHAQIIRHETPAELEHLKFEYHDRFLPDTPEQRTLVDTLIDCEWLLRRFRRVEAEIWVEGMRNQVHQTILGESFNRMDETFARLQRRIDATHRNYRHALRDLERLQAAAGSETAAAEPVTPTSETSKPETGFVPQSSHESSSYPPPPPCVPLNFHNEPNTPTVHRSPRIADLSTTQQSPARPERPHQF